MKILIVDDNEGVLFSIESILKGEGYEGLLTTDNQDWGKSSNRSA